MSFENVTGKFSELPEVVIYVSTYLKFTGYLAVVVDLVPTKFHEIQ